LIQCQSSKSIINNYKERNKKNYNVITSNQIGELFGFQSRTNTALCKKWVDVGFLDIVDHSNKARKYKLAKPYVSLVVDNL
jgi:hypothetical protein